MKFQDNLDENRLRSDSLEFDGRQVANTVAPKDANQFEKVSDDDFFKGGPKARSSSQRSSRRNSVKGFNQLLQEKHMKAADNVESKSVASQSSAKNAPGSKMN